MLRVDWEQHGGKLPLPNKFQPRDHSLGNSFSMVLDLPHQLPTRPLHAHFDNRIDRNQRSKLESPESDLGYRSSGIENPKADIENVEPAGNETQNQESPFATRESKIESLKSKVWNQLETKVEIKNHHSELEYQNPIVAGSRNRSRSESWKREPERITPLEVGSRSRNKKSIRNTVCHNRVRKCQNLE